MFRLNLVFVLLLLFAISPHLAIAGQIGLGDFTSDAVVQDFSSLGTNSHTFPAPLMIGNDTYDSNTHFIPASSKLGPVIGTSGTAIRTENNLSSDPGYIDIILNTPALRAGLVIGTESPWSADVNFYDATDSFLGTVSVAGNSGEAQFAAWETSDGLIGRIRALDTTDDGFLIIADDFIQEIPEPLSISLFGTGMLALTCYRKRTAG